MGSVPVNSYAQIIFLFHVPTGMLFNIEVLSLVRWQFLSSYELREVLYVMDQYRSAILYQHVSLYISLFASGKCSQTLI